MRRFISPPFFPICGLVDVSVEECYELVGICPALLHCEWMADQKVTAMSAAFYQQRTIHHAFSIPIKNNAAIISKINSNLKCVHIDYHMQLFQNINIFLPIK